MALTRQQKERVVEETKQSISEGMSVVFISYNGLTLRDMNELRNTLHGSGCSMRVVPKRLLRLALQQAEIDFDPVAQEGQVAVVWGNDAVEPAKILHEFAKGRESVRLMAGVLEGSVLEAEQVISLAKLPGRKQLLAMLAQVLNGPIRGFAGVLSGVPREMVGVLQAIKEKKEE